MAFSFKSAVVADAKPVQSLADIAIQSLAKHKQLYKPRRIFELVAPEALYSLISYNSLAATNAQQVAVKEYTATILQTYVTIDHGLSVTYASADLSAYTITISERCVTLLTGECQPPSDVDDARYAVHEAFAHLLDHLVSGPNSHRFTFQLLLWQMGLDPLRQWKRNLIKQLDSAATHDDLNTALST